LEQIETFNSGLVEPVFHELPQAHEALASG
jgi:hypothetical protein